jgi:O-antigen ligase
MSAAITAPPRTIDPLLWVSGILACALPVLMAFNLPPSATLLNQCLAVAAWGLWVMLLAPQQLPRGSAPLLAALGVLALGVCWSFLGWALPASLGWSALGLLGAAALLVGAGADASRRGQGLSAATAFFVGMLVAGTLSAAVALVQVFAPEWADGDWIAASGLPGRAVGNLRQPNHLCSLLLWSMVAAVALREAGWLGARALWVLVALAVLGVELSASRTGAAGLVVLVAWGLLDRRLSTATRWCLVLTPVMYGLAFGAMAAWGSLTDAALGAGARIEAGGIGAPGSPNSRRNIWGNTWQMVLAQPLAGVGFGEFNLAWTLTAFAGRPTAFFDHSHNLPLQLAVELGLPAAALVLALLAAALWSAWRRTATAEGPAGVAGRAAGMMVLVMAVHSLVEYPLWYAYFLLPTAFAWGLALGMPLAPGARPLRGADTQGSLSIQGIDPVDGVAGTRSASHAPRAASTLAAGSVPAAQQAWPPTGGRAQVHAIVGLGAGCLMMLGGAAAVLDYRSVVAIYAPTGMAGSLAERIGRGQRSVFFAHHADYAAATNPGASASQALGFERAVHSLLDTRLLLAWTQHMAATGRADQARWLAARLREFGHAEAQPYLGDCGPVHSPALQCQAPQKRHDWRDFVAAPTAPAVGRLR